MGHNPLLCAITEFISISADIDRRHTAMKPETVFTRLSQSKRAANSLAKSVSAKTLDAAIKNLQAAKNQIEKKEAEKAAKAHATNIKKLKSMMVDLGISADDLQKTAAKPKTASRKPGKKSAAKSERSAKKGPKKGTKVAPKYQLKVGKHTHKWTGRGRMPLVFKNHVESGGSLDSCLIKKSN